MKLRLWWVPLLLLLAPLLGRVPEPRDVPGFFAPIRSATSAGVRPLIPLNLWEKAPRHPLQR